MAKPIQVYEWSKLNIGTNGLTRSHVDALLKLNELHKFNYLDATSNGVSFRNYVGIIQVDNLTIEILPKADSLSQDTDWRDLLKHMLKAAKKIHIYDKGEANVKKRNFHLLEVYIDMFLTELSYLIKRGLLKSYRTQTSNTLALKGKLELSAHLSNNIVHKERFYTTHQVYDHNVLVNQIILFALNVVRQFATSNYLSSKANRLSLLVPQIDNKQITLEHFDKLHLNRKTKVYSQILEIAKVIIGNYSPSVSKGRNKMIALLFNMDHLWEEYLFQSLKKNQHKLGYQVYRDTKPLFTSGSYFLKPDIVLQKGSDTYIIDAKWKQAKSFKASQQDLRQIYAYCRFWRSAHGFLVYPGATVMSKRDMKYSDGEGRHSCSLVFLPFDRIMDVGWSDINA